VYTNPSTFDGADLSDVLLPGGRFMAIVAKFKYLGGFVSRFCNDATDVDSRVEAAGKGFGALRSFIFSSTHINSVAKRTVYESLILNILLYGAESWSVTEVMLDRLRVFHARCVRSMCRVSRKHTWLHHVSTGELEQRLGVDSIDTYLKRRQLRWLGHVARMDYAHRLPRRMLSSWVTHARPRGAPPMTYGRSIDKALLEFNVDQRAWPELAADRVAWREMLRLGHPPGWQPTLPAPPLALTRPTRAAAAKTNQAMDESLRVLRAPISDLADYRRLATADFQRRVALDGERVHPHPGDVSTAQTRRMQSRLSREEQREAAIRREKERILTAKLRQRALYAARLAAKKRQLEEQRRAQQGPTPADP
jgi:hypothetical protein